MFGQSLLSAFGSAACTTDTDQLFTTDVQTTSTATYQLNNATTSIPNNTYPGTPSNITYAAGKFGNAAVFNGGNSVIDISSSAINPASPYTISMWFNADTASTYEGLYTGISSSPVVGELTIVKASATILQTFSVATNGSNNLNANTVTIPTLSSNTWYNVVVIADRSLPYKSRVFINGVEGTNYTVGSASTNLLSTIKVGFADNNYFDGSIDQIRFFPSSLPQVAITALYNETTTTAQSASVDYQLANPNSIAYYKMSDATDQLGNYNGTAGNVNFNTVGKFGFAGAFNGSDSYVSLPAGINKNNNFSWSFWINFTSMTQYDTPIGFFMNGSTNFIDMLSVGRLSLYDGNSRLTTPNSTFATGNWYHVVLTKSSTAGRKFYVNGLEVASDSVNTNSGGTTGGRNLFGAYSSGGNPTTAAFALDGKMDQVRIYDSAISAANVTTLYNEIECPPINLSYLLVAGGAGGGIGGGGAGGLLTNYLGTPLVLNLATAYTVEIGVGGNGSANGSQSKSGNGGNSKFGVVGSEIIATGGGGAGTGGAVGAYNNGANGGSGGGSHANGTAGTATPAGQGFAGSVGKSAGGAGGGASTGGSVPTEYGGGNGGAGITSLISGVSSSYAGGGGGIAYSTGTAGTASDGGGAGVYGFTATGISGTTNTGGGGGGSNGGSSGGSGVVILRYPTAKVSSFAVTGTLNTPTATTAGTDSVLIFTTGTGTVTFS